MEYKNTLPFQASEGKLEVAMHQPYLQHLYSKGWMPRIKTTLWLHSMLSTCSLCHH